MKLQPERGGWTVQITQSENGEFHASSHGITESGETPGDAVNALYQRMR